MVRLENDCCDCAVPAYPCMGNDCQLRHNPHYYCDKCGSETKLIEIPDGRQVCKDCLFDLLIEENSDYSFVEGSEY